MPWSFSDQSGSLADWLPGYIVKPVAPYHPDELTHTVSTIPIRTRRSLDALNLNTLFDYLIFPSRIMVSCTQWHVENRAMQIGDTIIQQVFLPPFRAASIKLIFGVRVSAIVAEPNRRGFAYETLEGHAERGLSIFTVEQAARGEVKFQIETFSKPGTRLSRIVAPFVTRPYQQYCTRQALQSVRHLLEQS